MCAMVGREPDQMILIVIGIWLGLGWGGKVIVE